MLLIGHGRVGVWQHDGLVVREDGIAGGGFAANICQSAETASVADLGKRRPKPQILLLNAKEMQETTIAATN